MRLLLINGFRQLFDFLFQNIKKIQFDNERCFIKTEFFNSLLRLTPEAL
jgi:hypothetical protein